ncbi:sushi, nidogen and EGF-like domain-containing protein 1 [Branchiostoma lanceolatum]|uniref:sushi, nidogen and EGF-like domain-containing protein 1 n=1 Tax=Branchiostoma lanceolatum TaxID=7740 RepID=UPI00345243DB
MRQLTLPACLLASLAVSLAQITPVSNAALYPYGPGTADILDPAADDGTSGEQSLSTSFPFFGKTYNSLHVNTNGAISFGTAVTGFTTSAFPVNNNTVIAAFFTDIKTSYTPRAGYIYHRETTDAGVLARATTDIKTAFPADHGSFVATWVYVATWHEVGLKGATGDGNNLRNTFQLVLITNGCKSFVLFNYDQIQFLQGATNGGDGATGTGPNPAQVWNSQFSFKTLLSRPGPGWEM